MIHSEHISTFLNFTNFRCIQQNSLFSYLKEAISNYSTTKIEFTFFFLVIALGHTLITTVTKKELQRIDSYLLQAIILEGENQYS